MDGVLHRLDISLKAVDDGPNGGFEAILSTPTLDRDGEIVDTKAFDPLPARIPIDHDHGMSVMSTVGSGEPFYEGDVLRIKGSFASTARAQEVRALVKEGHIDRMSVAFINPVRETKDGVPHVVRAELINAGIVCIPANREAAITAAKRLTTEARMAGNAKLGARNSSKDAERLQAAHDLLVQNGAACGKAKAARRAPGKVLKSVEGSFERLTEQLQVAIREVHPEAYWVLVLATFEDSVTYQLDGFEDDARTFSATYVLADGVVTLGTPEPLDGSTEDDPEDPDAGEIPEEGAAAPAAAPPPASNTASVVARAIADDLEVALT